MKPLQRAVVVSAALFAALAVAVPAAADVDGAWGYFGNPRVVYAHGNAYFGFVSSRGDVGVGALRLRGGHQRSTVLWRRFGTDDHNNPALWVRPDGRIIAFWSPHSGHHYATGGTSRLYYRISLRPRSIARFGPLHTIRGNTGGNQLGYTYPSPLYVRATHTLWLFWRGGDWQPAYVRSRDGGRTWSRPRTLLRGGRKVYAMYAADGARGFHVALVPDNPTVSQNSLYYLHYSGGRWFRADGRVVGSLRTPTNMRRGDRLFAPWKAARNSWVLDVASEGGRPVVLYWLTGGPADGYWYARWDGRRWSHHQVAQSRRLRGEVGGQHLGGCMGGATLDHETPWVVYLSRVAGSSAEIDIATTPDGGRTWGLRRVTHDSVWPNLRPTSPLGLRHGRVVLWMQGRYSCFRDYDTVIRDYVGGPKATLGVPMAARARPVSPGAHAPERLGSRRRTSFQGS
jgi:hypothetical protein